MRLVLDTNILIDIAIGREPYVESALKLIELGYLGEFELWMGSSQVTDLIYVITEGGKSSLVDQARRTLSLLRKSIHVYATSESDYDAVVESTWLDLEDAFVFQTALQVKADAIITRDKEGFQKSFVKVFDCDELFQYLECEKGLVYYPIPLD